MDPPAKRARQATSSTGAHDALMCPVCLCTMAKPQIVCLNGHNLCEECSDRDDVKKCPVCRATKLAVSIPNLALAEASVATRVQCPHEGCNQMMCHPDLAAHTVVCLHARFECGMPSCNGGGHPPRIKVSEALAHAITAHGYRIAAPEEGIVISRDAFLGAYDKAIVGADIGPKVILCIDGKHIALMVIRGDDETATFAVYAFTPFIYNIRLTLGTSFSCISTTLKTYMFHLPMFPDDPDVNYELSVHTLTLAHFWDDNANIPVKIEFI